MSNWNLGEKTTVLVGLANSQLYVVDFLVKLDTHIDKLI